ncbi:MAG: hypothetical protein HYU66_21420 [Armatimonadetes bacterium]|nr:hypothetical protein [Armatimonadota bacterium]
MQDRVSATERALRAKYLAAEQAIANLQAMVGSLGTGTASSSLIGSG